MPWHIWIIIPIAVLLVLMSAFFSGSETAYSTLNLAQLEHKVAANQRWAKIVKKQINSFDNLLITLLIGNNIVNILISLLTGIFFTAVLASTSDPELLSTVITLGVLTPIIVIFGEIWPKIIAKRNALIYVKFVAYPILIFSYLFYPFSVIAKLFKKDLNITNQEKDLKRYVEIANQEGILDHAETALVKNAFDLDREKVISHYIPLKEVVSLPIYAQVSEAIAIFKSTNYSRLPLLSEDGSIVGMVHVSDLLAQPFDAQLSQFMRRLPQLPVSISLNEALETLRSRKSHMAIVVKSRINDEAVGIMTMEDILEELIGEIYDEHDDDEKIMEVSLSRYFVWGSSLMQELCEASDVNFEHDENETVLEFLTRKFNEQEEVEEETDTDEIDPNDEVENDEAEIKTISVGDIIIDQEKYHFEALETNEENNDIYFELTIK